MKQYSLLCLRSTFVWHNAFHISNRVYDNPDASSEYDRARLI